MILDFKTKLQCRAWLSVRVTCCKKLKVSLVCVRAGKPEKILEYIIRNTPLWTAPDQDVEDFILTFCTFMSTRDLCRKLIALYRRSGSQEEEEKEEEKEEEDEEDVRKGMKRRVVYFVVRWSHIYAEYFCQHMIDSCFLQVRIPSLQPCLIVSRPSGYD